LGRSNGRLEVAAALLHIVYLRSGPVLLTKKHYGTWRDIQDEYTDYMTSLGPWPASDVLQFLKDEYPDSCSQEEVQRINEFLQSAIETVEILASDQDRQTGY
jgi:hypothetical protein